MSTESQAQPSVLKNSALIMVAQFAGIFVKFFTNILLAWFLAPDDFGIAAIVLTIFIGLQMLSDVGIADSIVRSHDGDKPLFGRAAFVIQVARGLLLYLIVVALAGPIAGFYGEDILQNALMVGGLSLLIEGFVSTRVHVLQRNQQIKPMLLLELATQFVTALAVLMMAMIYPSVWALVVGHVVSAVVKAVGSHIIAPMSFANFRWANRYYAEIFGFGKWIFLSTLFFFVITQSDKLILGKLVDASELGIYSLASALTQVSMMFCYQLGLKVYYPILSQAARNPETENYSEKVRETQGLILPVLLIFCLMTFALAPPFFSYLYKDAYLMAGPVTQHLALLTWFMMLYDLHQKVPTSFGEPKFTALFSAITSGLRIVFSLAGFQYYGVPGFILGLALGSICGVALIKLWMARRQIGLTTLEMTLSVLFVMIYAMNWYWLEHGEVAYRNEISAVLISLVCALFGYLSYRGPIHRILGRLLNRPATA